MLTTFPIKADIVYSNSNLGEMRWIALNQAIHTAKCMLQESKLGIFCYFSEGMPAQSDKEVIETQIQAFGFEKVFSSPFHCYTIRPEMAKRLRAYADKPLPLYNPSGRKKTLEANDVVRTDPNELPLDAQVTSWLHGWIPPVSK